MTRSSFRQWALFILLLIIFLVATFFHYEWNRYDKIAADEAIQLAESLEALLHPEHLAELSGTPDDLSRHEYAYAKEGLIKLAETTNPIRFAYLLLERNNDILILMDSERPDSVDYSPPGQLYSEADEQIRIPFRTHKTYITTAITDRWGTWISVLVPVLHPQDQSIIAVFGIDFDTTEWTARLWNRMIPDIAIGLAVLSLTLSLLYILFQNTRLQELNRKLTLDEALYRSVFEQAPLGIAIMEDLYHAVRTEFGEMSINPKYEQILGRKKDSLQHLTWADITHPDDVDAEMAKFREFQEGSSEGYSLEKRFIKPDGSVVWVNLRISALQGFSTENPLHVSMIEDITSRKEAEFALAESRRRESVLLSHLPGMAYRCQFDTQGTMLLVSKGCYDLTGYAPESFIHNKELAFNDIMNPAYRAKLWAEWTRTVPHHLPYQCEYEITTAQGEKKWVLEVGEGVYRDTGEVEALEGIILDITDRKRMEDRLVYASEHDAWTGLLNRDYLERMLKEDSQELATLPRAVISINLSRIQALTSNYGFHYTQNLIRKVAKELQSLCSEQTLLFQTYENRFVLYIRRETNQLQLLDFSRRIAKLLEQVFVTDRIHVGIGILEIEPGCDVEIDTLLRRLLIASEHSMTISEKEYRAVFYDETLAALIDREVTIRQVLMTLIDNKPHELTLQYQPIWDVRTQSVSGFEALARIHSDVLGTISPLEFIPIAEKSKLIIPLGDRIIQKALAFLKTLEQKGYPDLSVSINISAIQLLRPEFVSELMKLIHQARVLPKNVGIEITESVFAADFDYINRVIGHLSDAGITVYIDDFGTGYSSLAREKELNVHCLKIDKFFTDQLVEDDPETAITGDIISLAHKQGHKTIAEGVELECQKDYLVAHKCDMIQGYWISPPLSEEQALTFCKEKGCHA